MKNYQILFLGLICLINYLSLNGQEDHRNKSIGIGLGVYTIPSTRIDFGHSYVRTKFGAEVEYTFNKHTLELS